MQKLLIVLLGCFAISQAQLLPLPVFEGAAAVAELIQVIQSGLDTGASIQLPNGPVAVGVVTLPLNQMCKDSAITRNLACHICTIDCTFVHNLYGGDCGEDLNDPSKGVVCICNDNPFPNGTIPTPAETCDPLFDPVSDGTIDAAFRVAATGREFALLCNPPTFSANTVVDSTGCAADCKNNHQYQSGGTCTYTAGIPQVPGQINPQRPYCICKE